MKEFFELLGGLYTWPTYALVALSAIAFGYLLRPIKVVPNDWIPLCVTGWTVALTLFTKPVCPPGVGVGSWRATNVMVGMIVGFLAWLFHNQILKRWLDSKLPFGKAEPNANPPS